MIQLVHSTPEGRARYRIGELYRCGELKAYLEREIAGKVGVRHAFANPLTGKLLVFFDPSHDPIGVAQLVQDLVVRYRSHFTDNGTAVRAASPLRKRKAKKAKPIKETEGPAKATMLSSLKKLLHLPSSRETPAWHLLAVEKVVDHFGTSIVTGLTEESARQALAKHGPNLLPELAGRSRLAMLIGQFTSLPVLLLITAAGLSALTGGVVDAVAIMAVVAINATIGFATETRSERTIRSLKTLVHPSALVIRDGVVRTLDSAEVVPGDLLLLRPGIPVAADARVIAGHQLSIDESALTGESFPVEKTPQPLAGGQIPLADRCNMAYMGTVVTGGQGLAIVVSTGLSTEMGSLQAMVGTAEPPPTPMEAQLERAGNSLVLFTGIFCSGVFGIGLLRGYGLLDMLKKSISLAIAAVPEGLPAVAMTTLALGMEDMRRKHVLIRKLEAVETLGVIQTICLDKTGTLTLNRMSVVRAYAGGMSFHVDDGVWSQPDDLTTESPSSELKRLLDVCVLCNEANARVEGDKMILEGSPTEKSLLEGARLFGIDVAALRGSCPRLDIQHRSESSNIMRTTHRYSGGRRLTAIKGSPLEVLSLCTHVMQRGKKLPLGDDERRDVESKNESMAGEALRVLGVAFSVEAEDGPPADGCIWLGLVGMADPIRKGTRGLIEVFHGAGIETVMITGDQTPTAFAIGKELNLSRGKSLEILESTQISSLEPDLLKALAERVHVFSRVSPAHKLQIVQALQRAGKVVAMTGDGINDGPALKAADIGIAMGESGTDIARDIADVVLEEDDLERLVLAVSHGRTIYANIRKSLHYLLSTNFSEMLVTFAGVSTGLGSPLSSLQLLWINLISDIFPSVALALEPPDAQVMRRPPREPHEPILRARDLRRIGMESSVIAAGGIASYLYGLKRYGAGPRAGTLAFQGLVLGQLLHALSCRAERRCVLSKDLPGNPYLVAALAGSMVAQALTVFVPWLRGVLGLTMFAPVDGAVVACSALVSLVINESTKSTRAGAK